MRTMRRLVLLAEDHLGDLVSNAHWRRDQPDDESHENDAAEALI